MAKSENKTINALTIGLSILCVLFGFAFAATLRVCTMQQEQLKEEPIKEGLCVYVEYPNAYEAAKGPIPNYLLVYDYETEKVIEVDIYDELVHVRISVGDTIVYVVDPDYTDADFVNVIKAGY